MDWLKGMNSVIEYIEENLTQPIRYESLSQIVGCSVYEFSRIFSFMAGISISEYIRRRRLSQAVFDIQSGSEKIIDIALKYCYESPTTFTRAFKELHGTAPLFARKTSVSLKTYPPISFILTVKGVNELKHRIEKKGVMALEHPHYVPCMVDFTPDENSLEINIFNVARWIQGLLEWTKDRAADDPKFIALMKKYAVGDGYGDNWEEWYAVNGISNVALIDYDVSEDGHTRVYVGRMSDITDPQIIEYQNTNKPITITDHQEIDIATNRLLKNTNALGKALTKIPAATWAVFTFDMELTEQSLSEAYTRILTEWMPISGYKRDVSVPHMEQYDDQGNKTWEIWLPVLNK